MPDDFFIAWRASDRRYLPLLLLLCVGLAVLVSVLYVVFSVVRVNGDSMAPALHSGDRVLVTRGYAVPQAGDIVAFALVGPDGGEDPLIKRVVAVPGDQVEMVGDIVYVNGELSEVAPTAFVGTEAGSRIQLTVPAGTVYVLGDNRPYALDSREIGPVPLEAIEGKGVAIMLPVHRARPID